MASWTDAYKKWDAFEDSDEDETTINDELVVTPHAPRETPATAADVFLRGPILDAVQRSRVYGDGKAFVDMPLKVAPGQALSAFRSVYAGDKDELRQFIEAHFCAAGSDLMRAPLPKDWTPEFPQRVDADHVELMAAIHAMWPKLLRVSRDDFPERRTLIARRFPFVVPGGRFREGYYWDSYWIVKGLLRSGMRETALGIVRNFLDDVRAFGYVPNGNRTYYAGRSQPPLLAEMVSLLDDDALTAEAAPLVEQELGWWSGRRTSAIKGLARYGSDMSEPRPESYLEDVETAAKAFTPNPEADLREILKERTEAGATIYGEIRAAAESGWDFSSRWLRGDGLETTRTRDIIPVDLNAFLYKAERRLAAFYARLGRQDDAARFAEKARTRRDLMNATFWDPARKRWRDVLKDGTYASLGPSLSDYAPLWAGIGPPDGDVAGLVENLEASGLVREFGVQATCATTGEQWDAPNAWPPLVDMLVEGLLGLDHDGASQLARSIGTAWLASVKAGFEASGAFFEKYDADARGKRGAGGEYEPQDGFGWTLGAAAAMVGRFHCASDV